ncbi:LytTR family DNA-binding domain-containing protein [Marivita hallyeonensis]|uniref:LytTr DNA-binding domain-containing protein n=1 Tax=Marivita hallyeonensis TaxID=996342 RepID=A0A1M5RE25_9RHOB|nr:LytTR family DNA-binding domain-containing protein [Marivita hallyeonensis]SHH24063.1 LytTr DNA-binding domain-containing protein [Marivita hallyeonensis]
MTDLFTRELKFWDLTFSRVSFDLLTYARVLRHERTLIFISLCLLSFFATDPSGTRAYIPLWFDILLWPTAFMFYLAVYHLLLMAFSAASKRWPNLRAPLPVMGGISLLPTVFACEAAVTWISNGAYGRAILPQMIFFFLAVQALETVFFKFIMPNVRKELQRDSDARHVIVGGERLDLSGLIHVEAREHHVHLTFHDKQLMSRARLGDIVAQTRVEDGVQPHRSWWVARDPAITPERKGGRMILRLRDDTEVPVARTRVNDVQDWLQKHVRNGD